jgi:hypothetical protein
MSQAVSKDSSILSIVIEGVKRFTKDARHFQIIYLSIFLGYGLIELNWEITPIKIFIILLTSVVTQFIWLKINQGKNEWLKERLNNRPRYLPEFFIQIQY